MAQAERVAHVTWEGSLPEGRGTVTSESSGVLRAAPITWGSRIEAPQGRTSPEELLAAAHAACYAMALSHTLTEAGSAPDRLDVTANCSFDPDMLRVTTMELRVAAGGTGLDAAALEPLARRAEEICPISNAIRGNVDIRLNVE